MLALRPRKPFAEDTVLIVDGTLVPTRDHTIAERSKDYRSSTNHQVDIDTDTWRVVVVGRPLAGNRNDCRAWEESSTKAAVGKTLVIADGGYPGTGLLVGLASRSFERRLHHAGQACLHSSAPECSPSQLQQAGRNSGDRGTYLVLWTDEPAATSAAAPAVLASAANRPG